MEICLSGFRSAWACLDTESASLVGWKKEAAAGAAVLLPTLTVREHLPMGSQARACIAQRSLALFSDPPLTWLGTDRPKPSNPPRNSFVTFCAMAAMDVSARFTAAPHTSRSRTSPAELVAALLAWFTQLLASCAWVASVVIYDSYETGDILQMLAAVSWTVSNLIAAPAAVMPLLRRGPPAGAEVEMKARGGV